jgi:muramoyltetrapeptide carboxypeptidase
MLRRNFLHKSTLASAGVLLATNASLAKTNITIIKPKSLSKGDTIGLVTPSSSISRASFEKALSNLDSLGFVVKYSENMRVRKGFLAGTDQQRVDDLHAMFTDESVAGIVCARGGYGAGRILSLLDYELIKNNPKVFVGYSDITALHFAIQKFAGLTTYHGPVGASEFTKFTRDSFEDVLMKSKKRYEFGVDDIKKDDPNHIVIAGGVASGQLVGGNLTLITSLMGTPYDIDFDNKLVFIEEIGESPYKVDRMFTQLLNSGKLNKASGIVFGVFNDCETKESDPDFDTSLSLKEVLLDRFGHLKIPIAYGLPFGHISNNATIPFGIRANFNAEKGTLTYLEQPTL